MDSLQSAVKSVLLFSPRTVKNYGDVSAPRSSGREGELVYMAEVAELLITELINVLSRGLCEGIDLWSVLETLRVVCAKIARHESSKSPLRKAMYRLKFSGQLVYVVKSSFMQSPADVRVRALLRLMLNQGVLLAALELIGRWNAAELTAFYAERGASILCDMEGKLWDAFLRICTPIGGVTLTQIVAGVSGTAATVKFDLMLVPPCADNTRRNANGPMHGNSGEAIKWLDSRHDTTTGHITPLFGGCKSTVGTAERRSDSHGVCGREMRGGNNSGEAADVGDYCKSDGTIAEVRTNATTNFTGSNLERAKMLLDEAEVILFRKWRQLVSVMAEQEALLFEAVDRV
ncbi:hypothetical protein DPX39_040051200 [Trypanosoma brucei equiperdum]|uniref:Uncharacterized protein n=1 Tax=Trypanosoma brucei equiperdum TaxID=630700 RepID=A0A3L6L981_9TRYP|nr:hypothetical protein DPX39_040051200 [Trypanosoma brucei equiperdum]